MKKASTIMQREENKYLKVCNSVRLYAKACKHIQKYIKISKSRYKFSAARNVYNITKKYDKVNIYIIT